MLTLKGMYILSIISYYLWNTYITLVGCAVFFAWVDFCVMDRNNGETRQLLVFCRAEEAKKGADGDAESSKDKEAEKAADQPQDAAVAKEEKADS